MNQTQQLGGKRPLLIGLEGDSLNALTALDWLSREGYRAEIWGDDKKGEVRVELVNDKDVVAEAAGYSLHVALRRLFAGSTAAEGFLAGDPRFTEQS